MIYAYLPDNFKALLQLVHEFTPEDPDDLRDLSSFYRWVLTSKNSTSAFVFCQRSCEFLGYDKVAKLLHISKQSAYNCFKHLPVEFTSKYLLYFKNLLYSEWGHYFLSLLEFVLKNGGNRIRLGS